MYDHGHHTYLKMVKLINTVNTHILDNNIFHNLYISETYILYEL